MVKIHENIFFFLIFYIFFYVRKIKTGDYVIFFLLKSRSTAVMINETQNNNLNIDTNIQISKTRI